jgi:hypothetical protein
VDLRTIKTALEWAILMRFRGVEDNHINEQLANPTGGVFSRALSLIRDSFSECFACPPTRHRTRACGLG